MNSNIYIDKNKRLAITLDGDNECAMSYDLLTQEPNDIDYNTEGILKELDTEIFQAANDKLCIDLKDFGVKEINELDDANDAN